MTQKDIENEVKCVMNGDSSESGSRKDGGSDLEEGNLEQEAEDSPFEFLET